MNTLSQKQRHDVREILAWLRGGDATPNPEMEEKFIDTITGAVIERMSPAGQKPMTVSKPASTPLKGLPYALSLKDLMRELTGDENCQLPWRPGHESLSVDPEKAMETAQQTSDQIDSVILAKTLAYLGHCHGHTVNNSQIQAILYIAYGIHLAKTGKRLIDEHPQMWEYGPVFPKAYNKIRKNSSDGQTEAETFQKTRPEIYQFLLQCFQRYAWTSASMLSATHMAAGTPWAKTRKKSPDKWGVRIDDELISEWFKEKIA